MQKTSTSPISPVDSIPSTLLTSSFPSVPDLTQSQDLETDPNIFSGPSMPSNQVKKCHFF